MRNHGEAGSALIEALVALMLVATVGVAVTGLLNGVERAEYAVGVREQATADAGRVLAAISLLSRNDLDRRLGQHRVGEFLVTVQRPERTLYRAAVAAADRPRAELLVTLLYRPEPR